MSRNKSKQKASSVQDAPAGRGQDQARAKAKAKPRGFKAVFWEYFKAIGSAVLIALLLRQFVFQAFTIPSGSMRDTLLIGDFLFVDKIVYGSKSPSRIKFFKWPLIDNVPYFKLPAIRPPQQGDIIVFEWPEDRNVDYIKRCVAVAGDAVAVREGVLTVNGEVYESNFADRDGDHSCVPQWLDPDRCPEPRSRREAVGAGGRFNREYTLDTALRHFWRQDKTYPFLQLAGAAVAHSPAVTDSARAGLEADLAELKAAVDRTRSLRSEASRLPAAELVKYFADKDADLIIPDGHLWMMGDNRFNSSDSRVWGPLDQELIKGRAVIIYWSWDAEKFRPRLSRVADLIR